MGALHYMKWVCAEVEIDKGWRLMSMAERGLYMTLLNYSWMNEGLPPEDRDLSKIAGLSLDEFQPLWVKVSRQFSLVLASGQLGNPRQEKDRVRARKTSQNNKRSRVRDENAERTQCDRDQNAPVRAYNSDSNSNSDSDSSSDSDCSFSSKEGGLGETKPDPGNNVIQLPSAERLGELFKAWFELWSNVRGSSRKIQAAQEWISVVTEENSQAVFECTASYLASLNNPAIGYNPDKFLSEQFRDGFSARWPPNKASPDKKKAARDEFDERMKREMARGMYGKTG